MNYCSDSTPSQTVCTTLCPPKPIATGRRTVLSSHLYRSPPTWTHGWVYLMSNIQKKTHTHACRACTHIHTCSHTKYIMLKRHPLENWCCLNTAWFCYREKRQWWVITQMTMDKPYLHLTCSGKKNNSSFYSGYRPFLGKNWNIINYKMIRIPMFFYTTLHYKVQAWTGDTAAPAAERPTGRQSLLRHCCGIG